jgi:hypothetical protein
MTTPPTPPPFLPKQGDLVRFTIDENGSDKQCIGHVQNVWWNGSRLGGTVQIFVVDVFDHHSQVVRSFHFTDDESELCGVSVEHFLDTVLEDEEDLEWVPAYDLQTVLEEGEIYETVWHGCTCGECEEKIQRRLREFGFEDCVLAAPADLKKLLRNLEKEEGATVTKRKSGHWVIDLPNGDRIFTGSTPSDWRGLKKLKSHLKRSGVDPKTLGLNHRNKQDKK